MVLAGLVPFFLAYTTTHTDTLEIINTRNLNCGVGDNAVTNGYVHLKNGHMFFSLFEGKNEAKNSGLVVQFEGGPGATAFDYPFIGAGPCQLTPEGESSLSGLSPAPYPWTDYVNLLVVDYPIGTGWSYNTSDQNPASTSDRAAEEFDDFLQVILKQWPQFQSQPLIMSTLSYGGTTGAHIAATILKRNQAVQDQLFPRRVVKQFDQLLFGKPFADAISEIYSQWDVLCNDEPKAYNQTVCNNLRNNLTPCLDKLRYLEDIESTQEFRKDAVQDCIQSVEINFKAPAYNRYHRSRPKCWPTNTQDMREWLGVTGHIEKWWYAGPALLRFINSADIMQNAYKLLQPVLESGTRLLVHNGIEDTMVMPSGTVSWMKRLPNPHLQSFRSSEVQQVSNHIMKGTVINPGSDYSHIAIEEAGHIVIETHAALLQEMVKEAVQGRNYNPSS
ncbi:uncharacterized protein I206_105773 [Kwoniella pini CBS 10737]|uniref:AB hydrolase-1 domain-containing protein n=1 Tax=Kwoniella pini CBS 10737 TaxID=1296096 RepID=A0A1B9I043_9TREE|nr:uncharacterized protein I206_04593 [Kwoniella pini CBS 10737]OCF48906.1 hypothetical protein I206_04593 [Kwoniella pini CBS 10737]